jgi:hypothetical protein
MKVTDGNISKETTLKCPHHLKYIMGDDANVRIY